MTSGPPRAHRHPEFTPGAAGDASAIPDRLSDGADDADDALPPVREIPPREILDAMHVPLLVLDGALQVVTANRAFCLAHGLAPHELLGRPLDALADGRWNIPELRALLETILPRHTVLDGYEIEQNVAARGRRTMLLHASGLAGQQPAGQQSTGQQSTGQQSTGQQSTGQQSTGQPDAHPMILLSIEDVTEQRAAERVVRDLVDERDALLHELPRRVATGLQIVGSVLRNMASTVPSAETRRHLEVAHARVIALGALQRQVRASQSGACVELGPYLSGLCAILAPPGNGVRPPVSLQVQVGRGAVSSGRAVSIGLAATDLVVHALEQAFPDDQDDGIVVVAYDQAGPDWTLAVSDNGTGRPAEQWDEAYSGLGTMVVDAVVKRLDACLEVEMDSDGTTVSVSHGARFAACPCAAGPERHAPGVPGDQGRPWPGEVVSGEAIPGEGS